jgi:hypothetical protein
MCHCASRLMLKVIKLFMALYAQSAKLSIPLHLVQMLRIHGALLPLPLALMACCLIKEINILKFDESRYNTSLADSASVFNCCTLKMQKV